MTHTAIDELKDLLSRFSGRSLEWYSAITLIGFGVTLLAPGDTFVRPWYVHMQVAAPEDLWGVGMLLLGLVQVLAITHCRDRHTYWCRLVACAGSAAVWMYIALPLLSRTPLAAGAVPYFTLSLAMIFVVGRGRVG